ncbi:protein shuttle craft-like [Aricia agestis]|uniref:protein shuttle craft-like n=1 Tax=Aricia agestis TaxID=91739 RepID=UPI001C20B524|nr:protein shuttle craft-like [Aricia agestis]
MSQWNNSYSYNGQQQPTNSWDGDVNRQYMNQAYYTNEQYDTSNQYVSFNDFISQMRIPNMPAANSTNYSNIQYQNYPNGQYTNMTNYQSGPSQPSSQLVYGYQTNTANFSNNPEVYQDNLPSQYNVPDQNGYTNVVSKSRLTPTASEFIPKSAIKSTDDSQGQEHKPEPQPSQPVGPKETSNRNPRPSSSTNWRERPQNSNQDGSAPSENSQVQKSDKSQKPSEYKNKQEESSTYSQNPNFRKEPVNNHNDYNNRSNKNKKSYDNSSTSKTNYRNEHTNQKTSNNFRNKNRNNPEPKGSDFNSENTDSENRNNSRGNKNRQTQDYESSYNSENNSQKSNTYWNKNRSNQDGNNYEGGHEGNADDYRSDANPSKSKQTQNSDSGSEASYPNECNSQRTNNFRSKNRSNQGPNYDRYNDDDTEYRDSPETSSRHSQNPGYDSSYRHEYTNQKYSNNFRNRNRNQEYSRNSGYYNDDVDNEYDYNSHKSNRYKQDMDTGRTYYNNSRPKSTQDVRAKNDNPRGRNWAGSQRVRTDYTKAEDEEFASSYISYREDKENKSPKGKGKGKNSMAITDGKELTQRERLSEQLDKGTLECLVCCERVKQIDPVWYCGNCYHVLHLRCIRKWAVSSMVESKWRCPACQNVSQDIPTEYRCMCGALRNPEHQRGASGAHTCGKACKRTRTCPHPCTLLCHPGPCPPCQATVTKQCGCGAETRTVLCSSKLPQVCGRECGRKLECNVHACAKECHEGPCEACKEIVTQVCFCPAAESRTVPCTAESGARTQWSCGAECGRVLACGAHACRTACHPPPCPACPLRPENVPTCPCGNTKLSPSQRKTCSDPIPLCDNICAKPLPCGPPGDKHFCKEKCHEGPCRICPDKTVLQCRCGHSSREVLCADLPEANVLCQRKCNKKMSCGRHRCRTVCCDAATHRCTLVCGRSLACQLHRCEEFCHTGHCAPCPVVSFEELTCACGAEAVLPPVRCGTRAPLCSAPCRKPRPCGHPPHHSCHSGDCPPCVVLTTKSCHGRHEERKTIPCSQEEFSCGMPCGKPLPCGKHTCIKTCHKGPCDAGKCTQACREKRPGCGHECAAPCHAGAGGACPSGAPCRRPVRATCACGRRSMDRACTDNARDYAKLMSTLAASKMQEGGSVDLSDVQRPSNMLKTLECDEECYVEARSRRMALALQIRNPDVSAKLAPRYGDSLRATAARDPAFAQHVHDKLTDLVQLAKKSKQKTRAHSFPSMNRQKRQFIHEMCEHFGCESVAYDAEPNRNVVATADREKSWLPAMSVLEVLAREAGKRRVPGPVLRAPPAPTATAPQATPTQPSKSTGGWATLTSSNAWAARSQPKQENKIDYFDNPPN